MIPAPAPSLTLQEYPGLLSPLLLLLQEIIIFICLNINSLSPPLECKLSETTEDLVSLVHIAS